MDQARLRKFAAGPPFEGALRPPVLRAKDFTKGPSMISRALAGVLLTLLLTAGPAAAQSPKPTPCTGMAATDPAGDQVYHTPRVHEPTPQEAPPATDLTGLFVTTTPDGAVRANLAISDLDTDFPEPATALRYSIYYKAGGKGYYLRLLLEREKSTWTYGTEADDGALTEAGSVKGELHAGKDGVLSFIVPRTAGGAPGTPWTEVWSAVSVILPREGSSADYMPDGAAGSALEEGPRFEYNGAKCPDSGTTPPPGGGGTTPPSAGDTTPPSGGGGGGTTPPSGGGGASIPQTEAFQPLRITANPTRLRAKKVKRKAVFTLSSGEDLTNVTARFLKGRKAVGTGKLAKLPRKGKLSVKVKRKLKKGRYTLAVTARRANGQTGTVRIKITVR
jgi:hypothetical protein